MLTRVIKQTTYGIDPRNAEQTFALDALSNPDIQLVSLQEKPEREKHFWLLLLLFSNIKGINRSFLHVR
jgi:PhoH-like ATPase